MNELVRFVVFLGSGIFRVEFIELHIAIYTFEICGVAVNVMMSFVERHLFFAFDIRIGGTLAARTQLENLKVDVPRFCVESQLHTGMDKIFITIFLILIKYP